MKINILCLYYDIMNLYGDTGNIKVIKHHLDKLGIDYNVDYLSIDDNINFSKYDLVLMGDGTEDNRFICLKHLLKYKDDLKKAVEANKFFLITGNALGMFGNKLYSRDALGIFNYTVSESEERISKEVILENDICSPIYGFMNHSDDMSPFDRDLFGNEGVFYKNFYGTYTLGPILSRNPEFLKYFLEKIIHSKDKKFKVELDLSLEHDAYNEFIEFKKTKVFNSRKL